MNRPQSQQLLIIAALTTTAVLGAVAVGWHYFHNIESSPTVPFWTDAYRSIMYNPKEKEILTNFDKFSRAAKLLESEIENIQSGLQPFEDGISKGSESNIFFDMKKLLLELSLDIDHIFGKLDHTDLTDAVSLRAKRKELIDIFAAQANKVDRLIRTVEIIESKIV